MKNIKAQNPSRQEINVKYDREPDMCPICHHFIEPLKNGIINTAVDEDLDQTILEISYRCPQPRCAHQFISVYKLGTNNAFYFSKSIPQNPVKASLEPEIVALSPSFEKIYNQALFAESMGLDEVSGVALRKSFEFLLKDYCINKYPDKEEDIKNKFLGHCIKEFVDDPKLKSCAERATWLGNDETHYVRKWEEHDIEDLKLLIRLSINWIVSELLTEKYLSEM